MVYRAGRRGAARAVNTWLKWRMYCPFITKRRHQAGRDCVSTNVRHGPPRCQLLDHVVTPLLVKPGKAAREDNDGAARAVYPTGHGRGAAGLRFGQRYSYTQTRKQRTKADYAQFINHIITTHYADSEYIDLVQDNLNTHKYGSFYEHLPLAQARLLSRKLVFHYTPKHGSWLNIAEPGGRSH